MSLSSTQTGDYLLAASTVSKLMPVRWIKQNLENNKKKKERN